MSDIHSCSYYCTRPACVLQQRDELRDKLEQALEALDEIAINTHDDTAERVARAAIAKAEAIEAALKEKNNGTR